jgi:superfamily II DNA helicase RecQ
MAMSPQSKLQGTLPSRPPKPRKTYKADEIDLELLASLSQTKLDVKPFRFQLEVAAAILRGEDVIADVGTGGGKTLCFTLPLLLNEHDITIIVSPLTALMIDQVSSQ